MDIVGIGTHVVECVRIGRMIEEHGELFLDRVFTAHEIRRCRSRRGPIEAFAGQWAAKEAILRCLRIRGEGQIRWRDVEVLDDAEGVFKVYAGGAAKERVQFLRISNILVAIAHCRAFATAHAIAVRSSDAVGSL